MKLTNPYLFILFILFSMNLPAQNEFLDFFCDKKVSKDYVISFKDKTIQVTVKVKDSLTNTHIDLKSEMGIYIENDSIQSLYVLNNMRMSSIYCNNPLIFEKSGVNQDLELYLELSNSQTLVFKPLENSCKAKFEGLNFNVFTIYSEYQISKEDLILLSIHPVKTIKQVHSKDDEISSLIEKKQFEIFKKSIEKLILEIKTNKITFAINH
tara:strand:+ start:324 stop:953 length:630 start_codon:yes stop_codon:yes gene_type:complete